MGYFIRQLSFTVLVAGLFAAACSDSPTTLQGAPDASSVTADANHSEDPDLGAGQDSNEPDSSLNTGSDTGTTGDATDGGGDEPDLPDWADHRLTIEVLDRPDAERADYNVVVSGRLEATGSDEVWNSGRFGTGSSSVWPGNVDEFYFSGRIVSLKLRPSLIEEDVWDLEDSNVVVRIDGERIGHESYDPSEGDLAYGFMGAGALPDDLKTKRSECDHEIRDTNDLERHLTRADDGDVVCVIGRVRMPEGPGTGIESTADDLTVVGFADDDGRSPKLFRRQHGDWGYGNVAIVFSGDRVVVQDLEFEGPGAADWPAGDRIPPDRVANYEMRGIEFTGSNSVVLNVDIHHFSHANISARGLGLTVLCTDTHHPWPSGRSYGVATGGPLTQAREYPGEVWPADLLANGYTRWHERTEIRRVLMDGGRHDAEGGTHGTYSLDQFVIGRRGVGGGRIDMHRPGGGAWRVGHGAIYESVNDGAGIWMRGWPEIGWRVHDVWFEWGSEPQLDQRHPDSDAPIIQVCATPETRIRREVFDRTNGPFINFSFRDCIFGEGHPRDIDPELGYYYDTFYEQLGGPSRVAPK